MAKRQILLIDPDPGSARLLEVSLRNAGFTVTSAGSAERARGVLEHGAPDLILTDTRLPDTDGFTLVGEVRSRPELADTAILFLTEQAALEDKLRGLELGVDDYLVKPIMVREIVTRVQLVLARRRQQRIAQEPQARTRFSGSLEDVSVIDLLQTIAVSGKSGVAHIAREGRQAELYFAGGKVIDADLGALRAEEAVYRALTWASGTFDVEFGPMTRPLVIEVSHQALLMEGLRRLDELGRLAEQLPPEGTPLAVDAAAASARSGEIQGELASVLALVDGKRTRLELMDASPIDDLATLTALSKLYFEGLVKTAERSLATPLFSEASLRGTAGRQRFSELETLVPGTRPAHSEPPEIKEHAEAPSTDAAAPEAPAVEDEPDSPPPSSRTTAPAPAQGGKLTPAGIVHVGERAPSARARAGEEPPSSRSAGAKSNGLAHGSPTAHGLFAAPFHGATEASPKAPPVSPERGASSPTPSGGAAAAASAAGGAGATESARPTVARAAASRSGRVTLAVAALLVLAACLWLLSG